MMLILSGDELFEVVEKKKTIPANFMIKFYDKFYD